jgi:hypothetical protein
VVPRPASAPNESERRAIRTRPKFTSAQFATVSDALAHLGQLSRCSIWELTVYVWRLGSPGRSNHVLQCGIQRWVETHGLVEARQHHWSAGGGPVGDDHEPFPRPKGGFVSRHEDGHTCRG